MKVLFLTILFFPIFSSQCIGQNILAIGGGPDDLFLPVLVEQSTKNNKSIYVVAAANESCERLQESGQAYKNEFIRLGCKNVELLIICNRDDADTVPMNFLDNSNLFLPGGDQHVFMDRLSGTNLEKAIINSVNLGNLYVGTSATTACIGQFMIASSSNNQIFIEKGLGLIPNVIFDQHYSQRNRAWRLKRTIKEHPDCRGIGIDESTGLFIQGNQYKEMGTGKVYYVNGN
jgi:cyanophycinase